MRLFIIALLIAISYAQTGKEMVSISNPSDICGSEQATIQWAQWHDCNNPITAQECFETCLETDDCVAFQVTKMDQKSFINWSSCLENGHQGYVCIPQSQCRVDGNHRFHFYRVVDASTTLIPSSLPTPAPTSSTTQGKEMVSISNPSDICGSEQATIQWAQWHDCNTPITAQECFETCLETDDCVAFQVTKMDQKSFINWSSCLENGHQGYVCIPQSQCRVDGNHRFHFYRVVDASTTTLIPSTVPTPSTPTSIPSPAPTSSTPTFGPSPAPTSSMPTFAPSPAPTSSTPTFAPSPAPTSSTTTVDTRTGHWCAREGGVCQCNGEVRYGSSARGTFTEWGDVTGSINCHNDVYGDPVPGVVKECFCRTKLTRNTNSPTRAPLTSIPTIAPTVSCPTEPLCDCAPHVQYTKYRDANGCVTSCVCADSTNTTAIATTTTTESASRRECSAYNPGPWVGERILPCCHAANEWPIPRTTKSQCQEICRNIPTCHNADWYNGGACYIYRTDGETCYSGGCRPGQGWFTCSGEDPEICPSGYLQVGAMDGNNDIGGYGMAGATPIVMSTAEECGKICDETEGCLSFTLGLGTTQFDADRQGRCLWYNSDTPNANDNRGTLFCARDLSQTTTPEPTYDTSTCKAQPPTEDDHSNPDDSIWSDTTEDISTVNSKINRFNLAEVVIDYPWYYQNCSVLVEDDNGVEHEVPDWSHEREGACNKTIRQGFSYSDLTNVLHSDIVVQDSQMRFNLDFNYEFEQWTTIGEFGFWHAVDRDVDLPFTVNIPLERKLTVGLFPDVITRKPTAAPTEIPTRIPTALPTPRIETSSPTSAPSFAPTNAPSMSLPTTMPTKTPSVSPSFVPSASPSARPTTTPFDPSVTPTVAPSQGPTTSYPSTSPTTTMPSVRPTKAPVTSYPTSVPTISVPTISPTTSIPTPTSPTSQPSLTALTTVSTLHDAQALELQDDGKVFVEMEITTIVANPWKTQVAGISGDGILRINDFTATEIATQCPPVILRFLGDVKCQKFKIKFESHKGCGGRAREVFITYRAYHDLSGSEQNLVEEMALKLGTSRSWDCATSLGEFAITSDVFSRHEELPNLQESHNIKVDKRFFMKFDFQSPQPINTASLVRVRAKYADESTWLCDNCLDETSMSFRVASTGAQNYQFDFFVPRNIFNRNALANFEFDFDFTMGIRRNLRRRLQSVDQFTESIAMQITDTGIDEVEELTTFAIAESTEVEEELSTTTTEDVKVLSTNDGISRTARLELMITALGVHGRNKDDVCAIVSEILEGDVTNCMRMGAYSLLFYVDVEDLYGAASQLATTGFIEVINSHERIPNGVHVSKVELYDDNSETRKEESTESNDTTILATILLVSIVVYYAFAASCFGSQILATIKSNLSSPRMRDVMNLSGFELVYYWFTRLSFHQKAATVFGLLNIATDVLFAEFALRKASEIAHFAIGSIIIGTVCWFISKYMDIQLFSVTTMETTNRRAVRNLWSVFCFVPFQDLIMLILTFDCILRKEADPTVWLCLSASVISMVGFHLPGCFANDDESFLNKEFDEHPVCLTPDASKTAFVKRDLWGTIQAAEKRVASSPTPRSPSVVIEEAELKSQKRMVSDGSKVSVASSFHISPREADPEHVDISE